MYKLTQNPNQIIRLLDNTYIPNAKNGDWQIFEAWLSKNTPTPADIIPPIVREIDARRLRLALLQLGKLSVVKSAVNNLDEAAGISWEYATMIREDDPLVVALSSQLNLDVNSIFNKAKAIV